MVEVEVVMRLTGSLKITDQIDKIMRGGIGNLEPLIPPLPGPVFLYTLYSTCDMGDPRREMVNLAEAHRNRAPWLIEGLLLVERPAGLLVWGKGRGSGCL